jgi:hypothetical protein
VPRDAERKPREPGLAVVGGRLGRPGEADQELRARVEPARGVAGDDAQADDAAALAGDDGLLQHDQVARRAERNERVRLAGDEVAVDLESPDERPAQAVRGDEDAGHVDLAAGDRDPAQVDPARAARGRVDTEGPAGVLDAGERARPGGCDEIAGGVADLGDPGREARVRTARQRAKSPDQDEHGKQAPGHPEMVAHAVG